MKKSVSILAGLLALGFQAQAALAPAYMSLRKVQAVVNVISDGNQDGLERKQPQDVTIHSMRMISEGNKESIQIDVGYTTCNVGLKLIPPPPGMAGASQVKAKINKCERYMAVQAVPVMKWEKIEPKLTALAKKGVVDMSFHIAGPAQAPLFVTEKKMSKAKPAKIDVSTLGCVRYLNCMPPYTSDRHAALCSQDYQTWAEANCPVAPTVVE